MQEKEMVPLHNGVPLAPRDCIVLCYELLIISYVHSRFESVVNEQND